jgi:hypothetical protein
MFTCGLRGNADHTHGEYRKTISLTQITENGIRLESILYSYIDTVDTVINPDPDKVEKEHEVEGYGLVACEAFVAAIVNQIYHFHRRSIGT